MTTPSFVTGNLNALIRAWEAELGPENLAKARYQLRMRVLRFVWNLALPLLFVLIWIPTGWAVALREALQANATWGRTWLALVLFLAVLTLMDIPGAWFFEFHVENRLGLNRQTFLSWLRDHIKQETINLVLQSALFLGLYTVFRLWPRTWFWGIAGLVVALLLGLYLLQPVLLRMQYKTHPLNARDIEERLRNLFARAGVPFGGLSVLEASVKTARLNAALVPRGAGTEVVLMDTLLNALGPAEIEGVVAHELGHKVKRHLAKQFTVIGVLLIVALSVTYGLLHLLGNWDGLRGPADVATFPLLMATFAWLASGLQVCMNAYARRMEFEADRFALEMTGNPEVFERIMRVLVRENKSLPQPPLWVERLLYTHPSPARRVHAVYRWASQMQSDHRG